MTTNAIPPVESIAVRIALSGLGDALFFGDVAPYYENPGMYFKQRLFAWHEASFYGTELEMRDVQGLEVVVLPSEQVIPFLADGRLLKHIEWKWEGEAARLLELAPLLAECLNGRKYVPDFDAFRSGRLQWAWDLEALDAPEREALENDGLSPETSNGLRAAFSAAVFHRYYGTEQAADLRRDYPLLFAGEEASAATAGMDARSWLVQVGWRADTAPFRPVLQLLEPGEEDELWRLRLVLQDKQDAAVLAPVRLSARGEAFGSWPRGWTAHVRERSASWLERLRASLPAERLADGEDVLGKPLDTTAAWKFLTADSRRLLEAGWQVLLPSWWEAVSRKKPKLRAKIAQDQPVPGARSLLGLGAILSFDWRVAIGDAELSEAEFMRLAARNERLVRFRGQWIALDPALLEQIRQAIEGMDKSKGLSFLDALQLHLLGNGDSQGKGTPQTSSPEEEETRLRIEVELNEHLANLIAQLNQQKEWPKVEPPSGLRAELRGYQLDGFSWLAFLRRIGLGACLADDMGLGKTVQLIAYLLHAKESPAETDGPLPSLIVCPTSVLGNWQKELQRFAPSLRVMLHYGSGRLSGEAFQAEARKADIVLTSYATAMLDQKTIRDFVWGAVCLDEAQNIKNAQTKQSMAVRSFPARHRIALTGTPIENRLSELWSIYDFITPGYLGSERAFQLRFATAIEQNRDERRTAELQRLVKPFMLRRKKKDPAIQLDLPDKNEMKCYVHLTTEQAELYDRCVRELLEKLERLEDPERKGAILAALTQLKQACDHPALLEKGEEKNARRPGEEEIDFEAVVERSSKLERLVAMVKELREEGDRCLIFTQYLGMGLLIQEALQKELGEPVLYLHGGTPKSQRDRMIERFQSRTLPPEEQPNVFILSLKAGGVGLNLTAANHVFHFDRWWNPAVENQATDRAYRMGQTRDVQVHKFISLGTIEERIDEMLENKQQLSDNVVSGSEAWITELSNDELRDLFVLRRELV